MSITAANARSKPNGDRRTVEAELFGAGEDLTAIETILDIVALSPVPVTSASKETYTSCCELSSVFKKATILALPAVSKAPTLVSVPVTLSRRKKPDSLQILRRRHFTVWSCGAVSSLALSKPMWSGCCQHSLSITHPVITAAVADAVSRRKKKTIIALTPLRSLFNE